MKKRNILPIIGDHRTPWDFCLPMELVKNAGYSARRPEKLERGVNFFVLALEQLGATTFASCEGHPKGFYVAFACDESLARKIDGAGYFCVEVSNLGWVIRIHRAEQMSHTVTGVPFNQSYKCDLLRHASEAWVEKLNLQPFWEGVEA